MGILDQVIGQVVGNMVGGAFSGGQGGRAAPGGGAAGGGLGGMLGNLGGMGGKYSPLVMALLALLASRHLKTGAGGYGSVLHDMFGRITGGALGGGSGGGLFGGGAAEPEPEDAESPPPRRRAEAPRGGGSGGFLDSIGGLLDNPNAPRGGAGPGVSGGGISGGGLHDMLEQFNRNGYGGAMQSWLGHGPNQQLAPDELEQALGADTVDQLARETGADRDDLLRQLSEALPQVVDRLSPEGRVPSDQEQARWV